MTVLQIVPQLPGSFDGVGDYALILAKRLQQDHQIGSVFAAAKRNSAGAEIEFPVASDLDSIVQSNSTFEHVILHYANYGFQRRGVPLRLRKLAREFRRKRHGRWITTFHELYASGPPWKSAFWLRPLQMRIAKSIAQSSDSCIVSSEVMLAQLKNLASNARFFVHPVVSNFGEPSLGPNLLANRDPHRWIICGGTALVERSLRSFRRIVGRVPASFSPHQLFVLGGNDNLTTRSMLVDLTNIQTDYRPHISAAEASQIFSTVSFAWLDYFPRAGVPTAVVLKSGAFAAACAHGVIPILADEASVISVAADPLPGPYFISAKRVEFPQDRQKTAVEIYDWYRRRAASQHLARGVVKALGLTAA